MIMKIEKGIMDKRLTELEINPDKPLKETEKIALAEYDKFCSTVLTAESNLKNLFERLDSIKQLQNTRIKELEAIEVKVKKTGRLAGYQIGEIDKPEGKYININVDPISDETERLRDKVLEVEKIVDNTRKDFKQWINNINAFLSTRVSFIENHFFPIAGEPELTGINCKQWQENVQLVIDIADNLDSRSFNEAFNDIIDIQNKLLMDLSIIINRIHVLIQNILHLESTGEIVKYNPS